MQRGGTLLKNKIGGVEYYHHINCNLLIMIILLAHVLVYLPLLYIDSILCLDSNSTVLCRCYE